MPNPTSPVLPSSSVHYSETVIGKNQEQYSLLPSVVGIVGVDEDRLVTTRWSLTFKERLAVLFGGSIWIQVMTFGSFKPMKVLTKEPPFSDCL